MDFFPLIMKLFPSSLAAVATSSISNLLCSSAYAKVTWRFPSIRFGNTDSFIAGVPPLFIAPPPSTIFAKKGSKTRPLPNCSINTRVSI